MEKHQQDQLKSIAFDSINYGLRHGEPLPVQLSEYPATSSEPRATFVTLHLNDQLRGCIGSLQAYRPLVQDISENAYAAAFRDPRFPPVNNDEAEQLTIHISVLSPLEDFKVVSEQDLKEKIRPNIDGLVLEYGHQRATFLPSVWESLPDASGFIAQLKRKAGMSANFWHPDMIVQRYTVEEF